jgi:actin-related protein 6
MNKQMQVLVGDQVDGVANGSLLSFTRPFERGYMTNIHCQIEVWSRLFSKILKINKPDETSLVLTEAPFSPESLQDDMNEVIFEDFGFNACLRRPAAWFSAYEFAKANPFNLPASAADSCVVVDSGFSFSHAMPFIGGKCQKSACKRVNIGGKLLTNFLKEVVSYRQWNMMDEFPLMDQVKEELCYVSTDFQRDLRAAHLANQRPILASASAGASATSRALGLPANDYLNNPMKRAFVMPDYQNIMRGFVKPLNAAVDPTQQELTMETERFSVPEVLFHPSDVGMDQGGIADAVCQAIAELGVVEAGLAAANLVLTGGNTKFPQFEQRFFAETRPGIPDRCSSRTYLPETPDYYAWQGAQRFVDTERSTGLLASSMVTRKEYLERGSSNVNQKFWRGW